MNGDFRNMTIDSESYTHALNETLEIFRIDLAEYTMRMNQRYVDMLIPPSPGVYFRGDIFPIIAFNESEAYFSLNTVNDNEAVPDVNSFEDVWKIRGPIYNKTGRHVLTSHPIYRDSFTEYPLWHPSAIYIAYIYALETFQLINQNSTPYSNVERELLDLRRHVRPQFLPQFDGSYVSYLQTRTIHHFYDEENEDLIELATRLRQFVGNHKHHVYRCYLSNTILTVEKGNDYRVIDYYRLMMMHLDDIRKGDRWCS